jgi:LysR family transcriptional regulator, glycine cleavage system transcriptional activator
MSLSLDGLRCFIEAARFLNFRAAARAVALSPAALGQQLKRLEDELGETLFTRSTRSVTLTEAGRLLLPYARTALDAVDECKRAARGQAPSVPLELVIGTRHELGMSWIVPMLDRLEAEHPGLTLHLYFGSGPDLLLRVRATTVDCAVTSTRLTDPKLDSLKLHEERYAFVGARSLLGERPLRNAADAGRHTLIDTNEELPLYRYWRDAPGGVDSLRFERILRLGSVQAIYQFVQAGRGVAVLPEYFVAKDLRAKRLVRVMPRVTPLSDHFRLVFRADDPKRSLYASLAATMQSIALS